MAPGPLVSVVVPTYQRARELVEAVRSVLAQTYAELEVLVEDDGSSDGSEQAVAALGDPRVRYAWAPNAGRPAPPRNRGIARARGALVAFLDSDDVWNADKLAVQVAALERDRSLAGVCCDASYLPPRPKRYIGLTREARPSFEELLRVGNRFLTSGMVVRREALEAVGGFDEAPELKAMEDYDLWVRLLRHRDRSIAILPAPLFQYRMSPDGITLDARRELAAMRRLFSKHEDLHPALVREALAAREVAMRRGELQGGLRAGTLTLAEWLRAPEVPLRRRLRLAAKAVLLGRGRV